MCLWLMVCNNKYLPVDRQYTTDFPQTHAWPAIGLPEDYLPLMALRRDAFVRPGDRLVAHGSISLEEVIVPHIEIRKTP